MDNKIKVLHIISGYGGGISSHIRNIAQEIDTKKVTFDVVGFSDYSEEFVREIQETDGKTFTFLRPKNVGFVSFYKHARTLIKDNGPYDVVLCHISGHYSLVFKLMCMQLDVGRFVVHAHKSKNDKPDNLINNTRNKIDQIISTMTADQLTSCSTEASEFVFGNKSIKDDKVIHIPNSIPINKYMLNFNMDQINDLKFKNNIPEDKMVIGNMSRFNLQKNHIFMIDLIEHMAKRDINFVWLFIGAGELEEEIKEKINEKNLSDYTIFLGRREDGNELYQLMDVFVLPSFYEGLPTVIVETQAAGVQAVVSDTITKEVDLGLNMVEYLSLNDELDKWVDQIVESSTLSVPEANIRLNKINEKAFNNQISAKVYEEFLEGKINVFHIGDNYVPNNK